MPVMAFDEIRRLGRDRAFDTLMITLSLLFTHFTVLLTGRGCIYAR